jgi:uncharacterized membrane protein (DUF485 family)
MDGLDESRIIENAQYKSLKRRRARYAWSFALISFFSLVLFIWLATSMPDFFARHLFPFGFFTVGMAAGLCIFVVTIALTGFFLHRCNVDFEPMQKEMLEKPNGN